MNDLILKPIGIIHSSFRKACDAPVQGAMAKDAEGWVEVLPEFRPGLRDLEGFDRIWLFYWFDRATPAKLVLKPYLDDKEHGVFATRSPCRPNPIGLCCAELLSIESERLRIRGLDMLDGTPLLDIKPYVPAFDCCETRRIGWLADKGVKVVMADDRFERKT